MTAWQILTGDALEILKTMPGEAVNCIVTSPPYWGLRDYGVDTWEGGDPDCKHRVRPEGSGIASTTIDGGRATTGHQQEGYPGDCRRCGAVRISRQIGLEATIDLYVDRLVELFREIRRVLRKDGTVWLNLGDAYANDTKWGGSTGGKHAKGLHGETGIGRERRHTGLKAKDLIGMPWRVAFALQADGWYLRADIIWSKPNPMPESVGDRPTRAHEYLFLLTRSPRYWYDSDAIREPLSSASIARLTQSTFDSQAGGAKDYANGTARHRSARNAVEGLARKYRAGNSHRGKDASAYGNDGNHVARGFPWEDNGLGRNKRSVWEITPQPSGLEHFAAYPEALVEPCILAGCPEWLCAGCGRPTPANAPRRVRERYERRYHRGGRIAGVVLDPFVGSGTTIVVALRENRRAIGVELNPKYVAMARQRIIDDAPLFNTPAEVAV